MVTYSWTRARPAFYRPGLQYHHSNRPYHLWYTPEKSTLCGLRTNQRRSPPPLTEKDICIKCRTSFLRSNPERQLPYPHQQNFLAETAFSQSATGPLSHAPPKPHPTGAAVALQPTPPRAGPPPHARGPQSPASGPLLATPEQHRAAPRGRLVITKTATLADSMNPDLFATNKPGPPAATHSHESSKSNPTGRRGVLVTLTRPKAGHPTPPCRVGPDPTLATTAYATPTCVAVSGSYQHPQLNHHKLSREGPQQGPGAVVLAARPTGRKR